jgi:hypothetical protein
MPAMARCFRLRFHHQDDVNHDDDDDDAIFEMLDARNLMNLRALLLLGFQHQDDGNDDG